MRAFESVYEAHGEEGVETLKGKILEAELNTNMPLEMFNELVLHIASGVEFEIEENLIKRTSLISDNKLDDLEIVINAITNSLFRTN